jgi:hypothetical protein
MKHVIMSGPIKPPTDAEREMARLVRERDGGGHSLSRSDEVPAMEGPDLFISLPEAAKLVGLSASSVHAVSSGWRRERRNRLAFYLRSDVLKTVAERLKQKRDHTP